ncbi:hypothetical protein SEUCBS139899_010883 [Sporothrix eucalyptigena]|uniref:C6 zinc finger domain containing protein n=1 Tax=Sporothrix eucalyptigena TaxID=1812306 RepID=A0ABP0CKD3_9PEZI
MTRVKPGERKRAKAPKVRKSTGRVCDGFDQRPDVRSLALAHRPSGGAHASMGPGGRMSMDGSAAMSTSLSTHRMSSSYGDPLEARSLLFFTERTIGQFQAFFPDDFWNSHVLQFALSQDCIRHALVSLSAHHERYMKPRGVTGPAISSAVTSTVDADRAFALKQHNLAIQSLLACGDPSQALHVHLVSCLIFICIEALQGEIRSAIRLFKHGLSMIEELHRRNTAAAALSSATTSTTSTPPSMSSTTPSATDNMSAAPDLLPSPTTPSFSESIVTAVVAFLNRFAVQVSLLAGDIDPELRIGVIAGASSKPTLSPTTRFHSLLEARESILNLAIHVLSGAPGALFGDGFLESSVLMLSWWTSAFDRLVEERGPSLSKRGIALLELHKRYLAAHLKVPNPSNNDTRWDAYVDDFSELVSWAEKALQPDIDGKGSLPAQFHMDLGVIPVMFSTVLRCRDPGVRRRALAVLRNHRLQEGIWDSSLTLRAAERIVMLEDSSVSLSAAGTRTQPQRVKSVIVHMDPNEKVATLQYGLEDHMFEEVLDW